MARRTLSPTTSARLFIGQPVYAAAGLRGCQLGKVIASSISEAWPSALRSPGWASGNLKCTQHQGRREPRNGPDCDFVSRSGRAAPGGSCILGP